MVTLRLKDDQLIRFSTPAVMGIVNVSPNSFFNPHCNVDAVVKTAAEMVAAGVSIIDIGGEATNPQVNFNNAPGVQQEMERVLPAIEAIRQRFSTLLSIDTRHAAVMKAAVAAGADMINDQRHLSESGALEAAVLLKTPVCLMHFFKQPRTANQNSPQALLEQIISELKAIVERCLNAGMTQDRIILDPGFGQGHYGKNADENFYLLSQLERLRKIGYPILSGWSRKSMIAEALGGAPPEQRLFGTIAADTLAAFLGADILRSHSVQAAVDAGKIAARVRHHQLLE